MPSCNRIGPYAFKDAGNLVTVYLDAFKPIDLSEGAFENCEQLARVTGNIVMVRAGAFTDTPNLKSITLDNCSLVEEYAFARSGIDLSQLQEPRLN